MKKTHLILIVSFATMLIGGCAPALYDAAERGDVAGLREMLKSGADPNSRNQIGETTLNVAVEKGSAEIIKLLLNQGADVNAKGFFGYTALHNAVKARRSDIVHILLGAGADVNVRNQYSDTPLHYAAYYGPIEVAGLILDKGADVNVVNIHGKTPLLNAAEGNQTNMMKFLISKGADLDAAIAAAERLAVSNPKEGVWAAAAKRLEKIAPKQETGLAAPSVISSPEARPSHTIKSDIDNLPAAIGERLKNSYAIVIGIETYRQKLPKADFAISDAKLMGEYLSKVMGYPEENIVLITNEHATKSDFEKYFEQWLANHVEKDGRLFIYYSGHGAPNPKTGDAYLVPYDGDPSFIAQTGYPLKRLYETLGKLPAREIIVALDACFSGAGGRSVLAEGARPLVMNLETTVSLPKNIAVMAAASGTQISSTYKEKGHGLFTYFMLKGIKDEGVLGPDGSVLLDDLFSYVKPQVERIARRRYNNEQTPQLIVPKKN